VLNSWANGEGWPATLLAVFPEVFFDKPVLRTEAVWLVK
jgi:hypothetical protein